MQQEINQLIQQLIPALATTIYTLIALGLFQLQRWIRSKYNIELNEAARSELDSIVREAVNYAEERAHAALKAGEKLDSDTKKALAIEFAMAYKAARNIAPSVLERLIIAQVSDSRVWKSL